MPADIGDKSVFAYLKKHVQQKLDRPQ